MTSASPTTTPLPRFRANVIGDAEHGWMMSYMDRETERRRFTKYIHPETLMRVYRVAIKHSTGSTLHNIFVSYETIAWEVRRSVRWVGECMRRLRDLGILVLVRKGNSWKHQPHEYSVSSVFLRRFHSWGSHLGGDFAKKSKRILEWLNLRPLAKSTLESWRLRNPFRKHDATAQKADNIGLSGIDRNCEPTTTSPTGGEERKEGRAGQNSSNSPALQPGAAPDSDPSGSESRSKMAELLAWSAQKASRTS